MKKSKVPLFTTFKIISLDEVILVLWENRVHVYDGNGSKAHLTNLCYTCFDLHLHSLSFMLSFLVRFIRRSRCRLFHANLCLNSTNSRLRFRDWHQSQIHHSMLEITILKSLPFMQMFIWCEAIKSKRYLCVKFRLETATGKTIKFYKLRANKREKK